jgi:[ribosomal protein S5]-alanine N-acetyltransferase
MNVPNPLINSMQPTLHTTRLTLRPFALGDAVSVRQLAGDIRVAEPTANIPHPYPEGSAEAWIVTHAAMFESKKGVVFAITDSVSGELLGAISLLEMSEGHARCELGYWVAHAHWSKGICSEAAKALIQYAHSSLGITRVVCRCLARNIGSARVMEKAGMLREGYLVKHVNHRGIFEDVLLYGIVLAGRGTLIQ